ncbi:unnamed protein product [Cyprideis torosa]|uniref:CLIP domain-containing serine protease n=1 Tax=Cyprideis torosa TaxID=163714 RepID=A0A7R8WJV5_9CRUS|nr:unnamed protein product [Cyprideis torosa]CAG0900612.1 unnamed protein product [Cyprideis torosa]
MLRRPPGVEIASAQAPLDDTMEVNSTGDCNTSGSKPKVTSVPADIAPRKGVQEEEPVEELKISPRQADGDAVVNDENSCAAITDEEGLCGDLRDCPPFQRLLIRRTRAGITFLRRSICKCDTHNVFPFQETHLRQVILKNGNLLRKTPSFPPSRNNVLRSFGKGLMGRVSKFGSKMRFSPTCGAVLLNKEFALTAAHCFQGREQLSILRLREHDLKSDNDGSTPVDTTIEEVILHPEYKTPREIHDIALVRLREPVTFSATITPVCLPLVHYDYNGSRILAMGWGLVAGTVVQTNFLRCQSQSSHMTSVKNYMIERLKSKNALLLRRQHFPPRRHPSPCDLRILQSSTKRSRELTQLGLPFNTKVRVSLWPGPPPLCDRTSWSTSFLNPIPPSPSEDYRVPVPCQLYCETEENTKLFLSSNPSSL